MLHFNLNWQSGGKGWLMLQEEEPLPHAGTTRIEFQGFISAWLTIAGTPSDTILI